MSGPDYIKLQEEIADLKRDIQDLKLAVEDLTTLWKRAQGALIFIRWAVYAASAVGGTIIFLKEFVTWRT